MASEEPAKFYKYSGSCNGHNKVFINPNFQRTATCVPSQNTMHINPKFNQYTGSILNDTKLVNKPKIYINPHFRSTNQPLLKPFSKTESYIAVHSQHLFENDRQTLINPPHNEANKPIFVHPLHYEKLTKHYPCASVQNENINATKLNLKMTLPVPITNSRYCLIRKNENKIPQKPTTEKVIQTMKISKYKSVAISNIKGNLKRKNSSKQVNPVPSQKTKNSFNSSTSNLYESRFKFIKKNINTIESKRASLIRRPSENFSKSLLKSNHKSKIKIIKGNFKKNNIPCPLFRKYGKCLRKNQGVCEFLHDKKHVSICRKFIKGVCHDSSCLLSHDLTTNKMPTCYFYLKGMCTKESCPYLHVKLNEKTKICADFLQGYCERGDECLKRHINICPDMTMTGTCSKKICPHPHYRKVTNKPVKKKHHLSQIIKPKIDTQNVGNDKNVTDSRYYKEITDDTATNETYELIKPTRCKLGMLPSFIQL